MIVPIFSIAFFQLSYFLRLRFPLRLSYLLRLSFPLRLSYLLRLRFLWGYSLYFYVSALQ